MPRAVITGDWHLEAGSALGKPDVEFGNTRIRDTKRVLEQIAAEPADLMVFLGDVAGRKVPFRPSATSYQVVQEALAGARAERLLAIMGNHDWTGERGTALDVIAGVVPKFRVAREPEITEAGGIQVGVLPWTPPTRMFAQAQHNPRALHQLVAGKLLDAARYLGSKLDPNRPSLLVGHWAMMTGAGEGASIVQDTEVVLDADELAMSGPWDVIAFGHYHDWTILREGGQLVCHVGPPLRGGFGEADVEPGYLVVEWDVDDEGVTREVEHTRVETQDVKLVTVKLDQAAVENLLNGHLPHPAESIDGAIVKVQIDCTEAQAARLRADDGRVLNDYVSHALMAADGAIDVHKPQLRVQRAERERRSELTVDADPHAALVEWAIAQQITGQQLEDLLALGNRIIRHA